MSYKPLVADYIEQVLSHPVVRPILSRLTTDLNPAFVYHSVSHTIDVISEAVQFAVDARLSARDVELLGIAAAYHDSGFLYGAVGHEKKGAELARLAMIESTRFSDDEINLVVTMIEDTELKRTEIGFVRNPRSELAKYLLDADLSNLGREDFIDRGELQRKESGESRSVFLMKARELILRHEWFTAVACNLRQEGLERNIGRLERVILIESETVGKQNESSDRYSQVITQLPLLLNSSLSTARVIQIALQHLRAAVAAEAATTFLLDNDSKEITFWALQGGEVAKLSGKRIPYGKGIVGWVIENQEKVLIKDVKKDPRFYGQIDKEVAFETKDMICVPLTVRGDVKIGALQLLNSTKSKFTEDELLFVEQFSQHLALAIDNSKLYEALKENGVKLEKLDKRKSEMITVIAHEFRTPLNIIQNSADLLASGAIEDDKVMNQMASTLMNGVQRLTQLIGEIRNVALATDKGLKLNREPIDIRSLFQSLEKHFEEPIKKRKLSMEYIISKGVEFVYADSVLLMVALRNLISNAIRFTPDCGAIKVSATLSGGVIEVAVADTGIGMEEKEKQAVFEKFYEVGSVMEHSSGSYTFKSGGLGLGLATVKGILVAHGSKIDLISTPGNGSIFSFKLPISSSKDKEAVIRSRDNVYTSGAQPKI